MDRDFKYNGSRYYDPTAYIALNEVQKGEKMKYKEIKTGEVWEVSTASKDSVYPALVIADDGDIATIIKLKDEQRERDDIKVVSRSIMYGCSRAIQHVFKQSFEGFIKKVPDAEFSNIKDRIARSLGLETKVIETVVEKEPELKELEEALKCQKLDFIPADRVSLELNEYTELTKAAGQLEVYKELYGDLLKRALP